MDFQLVRTRTKAYWEKVFTWKRALWLLTLLVEEAILGVLRKGIPIAAQWMVLFAKQPMGTAVALIVVAVMFGALWVAVDPIGAVERRRAKRTSSTPAAPTSSTQYR